MRVLMVHGGKRLGADTSSVHLVDRGFQQIGRRDVDVTAGAGGDNHRHECDDRRPSAEHDAHGDRPERSE
jgi:hypothetical protein